MHRIHVTGPSMTPCRMRRPGRAVLLSLALCAALSVSGVVCPGMIPQGLAADAASAMPTEAVGRPA